MNEGKKQGENSEYVESGTNATGQRYPNRVGQIAAHVPRFQFNAQRRLAAAAGCAPSTISRLLRGKSMPSVRVAQAVHAALERELGPLPIAEVFSRDGTYPTASACELCGCRGCLPESYYDSAGSLLPEHAAAVPGEWSRSPS